MCQHAMEPTRFRGDATPHILDLVFTNYENMIENLKYLPGLGNSDHLCISFDVELQTSDSESVLKYNVYCADYTKMRMLLSTINWECDMENLSVNDTWDFFSRTFDEIVKACVPLARPRYSKNIYMNKEALKLKNKKNHLWRKFTILKLPSDLSAFKQCRNALRLLTRQLRNNFERKLADNVNVNPKSF